MNKRLLLPIILLFSLSSCTSEPYKYTASRLIMDTLVEVKINGVSKKTAKEGALLVFQEFDRLDRLLSRFKPQSAVTALNNRRKSTVKTDPELYLLLKIAVAISEKTKGAFDVTLEPVISLYDFDERNPRTPDDITLAMALSSVSYRKINFVAENTLSFSDPATRIDLGGIAKGYALKRAADILQQAGISIFLVNAGGDIITHGKKSNGSLWRLGIQNPRGLGVKGVMELTDTAVVTSGDYERFFFLEGKRIHHILDPRTGRSAALCQSVTAIYPDPIIADAYATAIFVLGPDVGLKLAEELPDLEVLIIARDGTIQKTRGFSYEAQ